MNNIMWRFAKDLSGEVSRRQSLTDENFTTNEKLRALALELARDPKYGGHFPDSTFSHGWLSRFRRDFIISGKFKNVPVDYMTNYMTLQGNDAKVMRQTFSQDLYEEFSRRQPLTDEDLASYKNLRALALELAADPKYKGYLRTFKFCNSWLCQFREKFRMKGEKRIDEKVNLNSQTETDLIKACKETFAKDLYDEMSRRQSLTDENLATYENLRVLALELAADPKYEGYLSSCKFSDPWIGNFRKKFNIGQQYNTTIEKLQILQYSDTNPELTLKEIAEHFSTLYRRTISIPAVSVIRKNREKLIDKKEEKSIRETFSQDLYEQLSGRQSLTDENLAINESLRALAVELAVDPKYKGYLKSHTFTNSWLQQFRKKNNLEESENLVENRALKSRVCTCSHNFKKYAFSAKKFPSL